MNTLHRAVLLGGWLLLLPSCSPPASAAATASTTASTAASTAMLRANPAVLARLEAANRVLTQELAVIEQLNEPKRLSAKVGERFIAQLDGAAAAAEAGGGGGGVQQRFESAVAVPAECSEGCKGKWKTLSEVYGKYFACRPTCDEDVLREKTAASEGLDDECMKEQKCWEKIEESIFTKPDAAASTAAPSPP